MDRSPARAVAKGTARNGGALTGMQITIALAALLLMFTSYLTIHTEMLRRRDTTAPRHSSPGEAWIASLPEVPAAAAGEIVTRGLPKIADLPIIEEDLRNGGGHPRTMAADPPAIPSLDYLAFIGVFSAIDQGGLARRQVLRRTWFPGTKNELIKFEATHNAKLRFVVGKTRNGVASMPLKRELKPALRC